MIIYWNPKCYIMRLLTSSLSPNRSVIPLDPTQLLGVPNPLFIRGGVLMRDPLCVIATLVLEGLLDIQYLT